MFYGFVSLAARLLSAGDRLSFWDFVTAIMRAERVVIVGVVVSVGVGVEW